MQLGSALGILKPLTILTALSASPIRVLGSIQPAASESKSLNSFQTMTSSTTGTQLAFISDDVIKSMQPRAVKGDKDGANNQPTQAANTQADAIETSVVEDDEEDDEEDTTSNGGGGGAAVGSSGKSGCFSLESSFLDIFEENSTITIPLSHLQEGHQVVTGHQDGIPLLQTFTGQYFHRNKNEHFDFIKLTTADQSSLTVTRNHYVLAQSGGQVQPVMAGSLRLGDKLIKDGQETEILQVEATKEQGAASPIFGHDSLEINGFSVSTYSGLRLGDLDLLGYAVNSHILDTVVTITQTLQGPEALKPNEDNHGNTQALGQGVLDALHL